LLVGGRAPIGGGGLIRLLTLIPDAESPRLSISTIPDGSIALQTRGGKLDMEAVTEIVAETVADSKGEGVPLGLPEPVSVIDPVGDTLSDTDGLDVTDSVGVMEPV